MSKTHSLSINIFILYYEKIIPIYSMCYGTFILHLGSCKTEIQVRLRKMGGLFTSARAFTHALGLPPYSSQVAPLPFPWLTPFTHGQHFTAGTKSESLRAFAGDNRINFVRAHHACRCQMAFSRALLPRRAEI